MSASSTAASKHHTFTSPESFGLFMEALRGLQTYADESEQLAPDAKRLDENLDCALEALTRCHEDFPDDLLPRYYLGIALTMRNQHLYADAILQAITRGERGQGTSPTAAVPQNILSVILEPRPWPLLDRAINLFEQVIEDGYAVLGQAAKFNLAHVYAKRDAPGDLEKSLSVVDTITRPSGNAPALSGRFHRWSLSLRYFQKKYAAGQRAYRESVALGFQATTLATAVRAREAIETDDEAAYIASLQAITTLRDEIEQAKSLNPEAKHDLLADSCTKTGFVILLHSIRHSGEESDLKTAESSISRALNYKPFWIPAQTYLALVHVAQARLDDAKKELESVLGSVASQ